MKVHAVKAHAMKAHALPKHALKAHAWKGLAVPYAPVLAGSQPAFELVSGTQAPAETKIS